MGKSAKRVEVLPAKRQAMVLEWLRGRGVLSIQELANRIGASASTIRRDLEHLARAGHLERTFGGAMLVAVPPTALEFEPSIVAQLALPQKRAIGAAAADRLKPHQRVIFDASTTVLEAARTVARRGLALTALTNGLDIALALADQPDISVVVTGGTVRGGFAELVGDPGCAFLRSIRADVCLLGIHALTGSLLTEVSFEAAAGKRAMLQTAGRRILLADSSKFQRPALSTVCDLSLIDELITDEGIDGEQLAALRATRLQVAVVAL